MRIIAVDPGGTTGIARYDMDEELGVPVFTSFELPTMAALDAVRQTLETVKVDLLVCELFIIGTGTTRKTRAGSYAAIHSVGALMYLAHWYGVPFDGQAPTEKEFADNAKLAKLGWRRPSKGGHADDAARHLLVAAVKNRVIPASLFLEEEDVPVGDR